MPAAFTVIWMSVVPLPAEFVAVIVCFVDACVPVGVPEMAQLEVLRVNPVGRAGDDEQCVRALPVRVGVNVVIALFWVYVYGPPL